MANDGLDVAEMVPVDVVARLANVKNMTPPGIILEAVDGDAVGVDAKAAELGELITVADADTGVVLGKEVIEVADNGVRTVMAVVVG